MCKYAVNVTSSALKQSNRGSKQRGGICTLGKALTVAARRPPRRRRGPFLKNPKATPGGLNASCHSIPGSWCPPIASRNSWKGNSPRRRTQPRATTGRFWQPGKERRRLRNPWSVCQHDFRPRLRGQHQTSSRAVVTPRASPPRSRTLNTPGSRRTGKRNHPRNAVWMRFLFLSRRRRRCCYRRRRRTRPAPTRAILFVQRSNRRTPRFGRTDTPCTHTRQSGTWRTRRKTRFASFATGHFPRSRPRPRPRLAARLRVSSAPAQRAHWPSRCRGAHCTRSSTRRIISAASEAERTTCDLTL